MNHKLIIYLAIVITALITTSCNQTISKRSIKGIIYDSVYGMPIENVTLSYHQYNNYLSSTRSETTTDESGQFEFRERKFYGKTGKIEIHAWIEPDFFGVENGYDFGMVVIEPSDIKMFSDNKLTFKSPPFSFLKVTSHNINPFDENDQIKFKPSGEPSGVGPLATVLKENDTYIFLFIPESINVFKWSVRKNNIIEYFSDSVVFPIWDTVEYVVNY